MEEKVSYFEHIHIWYMVVTLTGKLLDTYYIKDRLEIESDALLEKAFDLRKVTALE